MMEAWRRERVFIYNCCNGVQTIDQQEEIKFDQASFYKPTQRGISSIFKGKVQLQNLA